MKTAKEGKLYEKISILDCETAVQFFSTEGLENWLKKKAAAVVAKWNEQNGSAENEGLRVSTL